MITYIILMVFCELLSAISQLLLKKSATEAHTSAWREYLNLNVIAGYVILIGTMFLVIYCYGKMGYMNVIIIEPLGYVFELLLSRIIFHEPLHWRKCLGSGLILVGIYIFYVL